MIARRLPPPWGARPTADDAPETDATTVRQAQAYLRARSLGTEEADSLPTEAWERFFLACDTIIHDTIRTYPALTGHQADAAQEVWKVLVQRLPGLRFNPQRGRFRSWLVVLVRHTLFDYERQIQSHPVASLAPEVLDDLPSPAAAPPDTLDRQAEVEWVHEIIAAVRTEVPETTYRILVMRWVEGFDVAAIAVRLGLTPAQIRFRHHRAMIHLRQILCVSAIASSDRT